MTTDRIVPPPVRFVQAAGREAVVVLCSRDRRGGDRLWGALPPMPVVAPWWPEAWDVVEAVRQRYGIDVTVLRLLTTSRPRMPGGTVSYLAEISPAADLSELPLTPWTASDPLAPEPMRQAWAHPDGPRRLVAWAQDRLEAADIALRGVAEQRKTWNLSTLWRLPTGAWAGLAEGRSGLLRARGRADGAARAGGHPTTCTRPSRGGCSSRTRQATTWTPAGRRSRRWWTC